MGADRGKLVIHGPQLGAQGFNMGIHGAIEAVALLSPDFIHQLLARIDTARRVQQRFKQQELVACQG